MGAGDRDPKAGGDASGYRAAHAEAIGDGVSQHVARHPVRIHGATHGAEVLRATGKALEAHIDIHVAPASTVKP